MRRHVIACSLLAVGGGVALSPPARADYKGLFLIINPFDQKPCAQGGHGTDWLDLSQCSVDANGKPNKVPLVLQGGYIGGVFLQMNWDDYEYDVNNSNRQGFLTTLAKIAALARPNIPINLTIGIGAGVRTPCDVLAATPTSYAAIWNDHLGTPACEAVPVVYNTYNAPSRGDTFAHLYISVVQDALNNYTSFYRANSANQAVLLTGVKVGGLNTEDIELQIVGDSLRPTSDQNLTKQCSSGALPGFCSSQISSATTWLQNYAYTPAAVDRTWTLIASGIGALATNSQFRPMLEINSLTNNPVPPIVAPPGQDMNNFACTPFGSDPQTACVVYNNSNTSLSSQVGTNFVEYNLLTDMVSSGILPSSIAVQDQSLNLDSPDTAMEARQRGDVLTIPCWAYLNTWTPPASGNTSIGFQTDVKISALTQQDASNYLSALDRGIAFGAVYEEVFPATINQYVNSFYPYSGGVQSLMNNLGNVQSQLLVNDPSAQPNCKTFGG